MGYGVSNSRIQVVIDYLLKTTKESVESIRERIDKLSRQRIYQLYNKANQCCTNCGNPIEDGFIECAKCRFKQRLKNAYRIPKDG